MKRQLFWIAELFIWLLILFLVSGGIIFTKYKYKRAFNTYQIFLPDVDGLINGSPVRLMGIHIGYVNQIDIVGDDVYVKFIITKPDTKIPMGSKATVEFSGLGGSKSLEIYPPKGTPQSPDKLLFSQRPKRISDSLGLLNDMFEQIMDIAYTVSSFMNKIVSIKPKNQNNVNSGEVINKFLDDSGTWIDRTQKHVDRIGKKIEKK